ncbi:MAG: DUF885 family protein, partial [Planctomycetes bacterium]|nr:DUF885 family protein [Planctomycetota bacterium]
SVFPRSICVQATRDCIERPGIRCAPTIGLLQLTEMRDQAQARLGEAFNPNAFHRKLLAESLFPIPQLREAILLWSLDQL